MKRKIVVVNCENYNENKVYEKIKKGIDLLEIKKTPEKILIKPNMLSSRKPEEGVTTHPSIISALIEIFKDKEIIIGDSPANVSKTIEEYWEKCGYKVLSEKYNVPLVKFTDTKIIEIDLKNKKYKIPVTSKIENYSILNVPKFKTHNLTTLTLGIKNLYGLIPGSMKSILHSKFINPFDFSLFLVEFYKKIEERIFLTVVDGIISMEGDGPSSGKLKNTGFIIIGERPIDVDYICCLLIDLEPERVDFIRIYKEKYGIDEIEIIGDKFEKISDFKLPSTKKYFFIKNKFISKLLLPISKFFKVLPFINLKNCKRCFACLKICPVRAISEDLKIDRKKCILCFCCFEVCQYKAVIIKKSFIAKILT